MQYIISAVRQNGYLNVESPRSNVTEGPDNVSYTTWWDSGLSASVCDAVDRLLQAAMNWPNNWIQWQYFGPNSTTAADQLGRAGGFNVPMPPHSPGWGATIVRQRGGG